MMGNPKQPESESDKSKQPDPERMWEPKATHFLLLCAVVITVWILYAMLAPRAGAWLYESPLWSERDSVASFESSGAVQTSQVSELARAQKNTFRAPSNGGELGDLFGAFSALSAGLAFVAVLCAFFLQRRELALYKSELKAVSKTMEQQVEQMRYQRIESHFFQLLELHRRSREGFHFAGPTGTHAIELYLDSFDQSLLEAGTDAPKYHEIADDYFYNLAEVMRSAKTIMAFLINMSEGGSFWSEIQGEMGTTFLASLTTAELRLLVYAAEFGRSRAWYRDVYDRLDWQEEMDVETRIPVEIRRRFTFFEA